MTNELPRNFGVELELHGMNVATAARVLALAGIDARAEAYNHATRTWWKVVTDCSVVDAHGRSHYENGLTCEIVSPILSGEEGLLELAKVCKILTENGGKVNKSCGLHVHINARGLDPKVFALTAARYAKYEQVIDSFMPASRRASNNSRFCASIVSNVNNNIGTLANAASVDSVYRVFGGRFFKLNFESYLRHGTIEFRHHSGSLNAEKVCNWVKFCQAFVETSNNLVSTCFVNLNNAPVAAVVVEPTRGPRIRYAAALRGRPANPDVVRLVALYRQSVVARATDPADGFYPRALAGAFRTYHRTIPTAYINSLRTRGYTVHSTRYAFRIENPEHMGFTEAECQSADVDFANLGPRRAPVVNNNNFRIELPLFDNAFAGLSDSVVSYYEERIADLAAA